MKIREVSTINSKDASVSVSARALGTGSSLKIIKLELPLDVIRQQTDEPITNVIDNRSVFWFYKGKLVALQDFETFSIEEIKLRVKHFILTKGKELNKIQKEVEAFENFDSAQTAKREKIADNVRLFVWQRDEGKCVKCGNKEKLEFDHIIPVIKGGSNTERNIQLLCESCNRSKGKDI